jgi:preprotein translocase subunit YajC
VQHNVNVGDRILYKGGFCTPFPVLVVEVTKYRIVVRCGNRGKLTIDHEDVIQVLPPTTVKHHNRIARLFKKT